MLLLRIKYLFHRLPLICRLGISCAALKLADVRLPLGLAGQGGESGHITIEVEVIHSVHNHEQRATVTINLHGADTYLMQTSNHFGPYVGVGLYVFRNHFLVIDEGECLTKALHLSVEKSLIRCSSERLHTSICPFFSLTM